ncbi:MAG: glycosyltransferase family 4 protein [Deltaproteobacteria bacterium]|nr:glycosyltransferase family 4 protein [Deltaproteobacteria bacterium]
MTGDPQPLQPALSPRGRILQVSHARAAIGRGRRDPWLLVAEGFHSRGGMDKANAALASYLEAQGVPVHLVAFSIDPELSGKPGVTCTDAQIAGRWPSLGRFRLARRGRAMALRLTSHSRNARVVVNGINCNWPDINWVHWLHQCWQPPALKAPLWFRLKHRLETSRAIHMERTAFRSARLLVANSERTRRDLISLLGVSAERIHTIYLGTDSTWKALTPDRRDAGRAWLGVPPGRLLVAFVGALGYDSRKGFDTLWRAWIDLCGLAEWDADLVVAGSGRALPDWRREAARSGLGGRVRFLGFTERVFDVLAASDLLVSPARYESYGLNVQEALCCGVPAIVSAAAGVAERYSSDLSPLLLPNPEDACDLATRMLHWRRDIAGWRRRLEPTMQILRTYTWNDMASRIVNLAEPSKAAERHK